jgi:DNA-directed RNA polymerase specialized sigma24 family protein
MCRFLSDPTKKPLVLSVCGNFGLFAGISGMEPEIMSGGAGSSAFNAFLEVLASQDWEAILTELLRYTMSLMKNREWLSVWGGHLPGAREARDIVMSTVEDIIEQKRRIPNDIPLLAFLKNVIRSKVSHLVNSLENRRTTRLAPSPGEGQEFENIHEPKGNDPLPDCEAISKETETKNAHLLDLLIEFLSDDSELQKVIECNLDGIFKREEIASRLAKPVKEITNIKKRLDRRLAAFREKYADQNPFLEGKK